MKKFLATPKKIGYQKALNNQAIKPNFYAKEATTATVKKIIA